MRTTSKTVTFMHPFSLNETLEVRPAGTYTVETDEELLQASSSIFAVRRIATLLRLERTTGTALTSDRRNNSGGARRGLSKRRAAGRNGAATGLQHSCRVSEKGAWLDQILPSRLETLGYLQRH